MSLIRLIGPIILLVLPFTAHASAQLLPVGTLHGPVPLQHVLDGDTIVLYSNLGPRTVRLIGIDAPELDQRDPHGAAAADRLRLLLPAGSQVWVETDHSLVDIYGRLLGYVYVTDAAGDWQLGPHRATQVNLAMLQSGWARTLEIEPNTTWADLYRQAEQDAASGQLGIWAAADAARVDVLPEGPISIACVLFNPDTPGDAEGELVILRLEEPLDTRGYYVYDEGSRVRITLPPGLQPLGELVVAHSGQQGIWNNSGDTIFLYQGDVLVDSWTYDGGLLPENAILCRDGSVR